MEAPSKYPVVVIQTTANSLETRLVRDSGEFASLIERIMEDPTTVGYEVFVSHKLVTKTVEWKEQAK